MIDLRKVTAMTIPRAKNQDSGIVTCTITNDEVEAAAKAWLTWQFQGRTWETATPQLQDKMREGARVVLAAAAIARARKI